ncbi:MAG: hypothetical protein KC418_08080 [Anaerolineales bacterium]|nr:hypothetical protein [Anaerolineales bacterium]MCB8951787.1 hypothetical protein [Ardenticatenales bacterium]
MMINSLFNLMAARGLAQISDESALAGIVAQILAQNEDQVAVYRAGKTRIRGWFVGQVMQATGGKANPTLVNKLLDEQLYKEV